MIVKCHNIGFAYDKNPVLENISFSIDKGEYVGIIGPNGGGKTTLLKILAGLLSPTSGTVYMEKGLRVGYVPQRIESALFPATVQEIVESGQTGNAQNRKNLEAAMDAMDIAKYKNQLINNLSGGERQRVFIARALAADPQILALDEPYIGIDTAAQETFYSTLEMLNSARGITVLFISHDIEMIAKTATRCLCINRRLICHGLPRDIMKNDELEKLYGKKLSLLHHAH